MSDRPALDKVKGQNYAAVTILMDRKKSDFDAMSVLGCFETAEESNAFARQYCRDVDGRFDIYTVQMRSFSRIPPPLGGMRVFTDNRDHDMILNHHLDVQKEELRSYEDRKEQLLQGKVRPWDGMDYAPEVSLMDPRPLTTADAQPTLPPPSAAREAVLLELSSGSGSTGGEHHDSDDSHEDHPHSE